jgi:putative methyltransferase (TIGR04325 family)
MSHPSLWRDLAPPLVLDLVRRATGRTTVFKGPYSDWERATADAQGYDAAEVLNRVGDAARKVLRGEAPYERDGMLFDHVEYSFPVLSTLLLAAARHQRNLTVLDIGGSLGSSYRDCRPLLGIAIDRVRWLVVEQPALVDLGRMELQTEELRFFPTIAEAVRDATPSVVLLSSVLQYLPLPWATLDEVQTCQPSFIVIDRTIINDSPTSSVYVQCVPRRMYKASYPVWSLSRERIMQQLAPAFDLVSEHGSLQFPALGRIASTFEGFIFARKGWK